MNEYGSFLLSEITVVFHVQRDSVVELSELNVTPAMMVLPTTLPVTSMSAGVPCATRAGAPMLKAKTQVDKKRRDARIEESDLPLQR
jgi:hypothetical protein